MSRQVFVFLSACVVVIAVMVLAPGPAVGQRLADATPTAAAAQTGPQSRTPWGAPDLQGVWSFATLTPLERPDEFAGKAFLTEAEAAEYERRTLEQANADRRDGRGLERRPGEDTEVARAYNEFWFERGSLTGGRRTSLIVDPPDGKLPPMTPLGKKRADALRAYQSQGVRGPLDAPRTRPLRERCIWWDSTGPPLAPMRAYNQHLQLLQSEDHVVLLTEMIHDARIVPLDGRPHLPRSIPQLLGDSRGRWDGDVLVIETTNFKDHADFMAPSSFTPQTDYRRTDPGPRLVERLTRIGPDTLRYEYTVHDPSTWTRPWTAELLLMRIDDPIYEYACHEGNYGMLGILASARADDARADEKRSSDSGRQR